MNEKNLDYLSNQIKLTGFGENHAEELKDKIQKQTPEFIIFHQQDYGKDNVVASLQFRKSAETDMYFFNRYSLLLKNDQHPDTLKQTFFINAKESNITLKEGYNLMSGRSVHKTMTTKEGEKYQAWLQLDFKNTDAHGNFKIKQYPAYSLDLEKTLAKYPIKELGEENFKTRLIESLERGNRQSVTLAESGKEQKVFIEASPQYKSLNFYDIDMKRVNSQSLLEKQNDGVTQKQDAKKESLKAGADDEAEPAKPTQKNNRRKGQRVG